MRKLAFLIVSLLYVLTIHAQSATDTPEPTDVICTVQGSSVVISWARPTGTDGKNVTYNVYNKSGEKLASGLSEATYTDNSLVMTGEQERYYYRVSAVIDAAESNKVRSSSFVIGDAYDLPFHESFDKTNPTGYFWWGDNTGWSSFSISNRYTVDDEYGAMVLNLVDLSDKSTINTGKISLAGAANPALMFSQGVWAGYDMQMNVYVTTADGTKTLLQTYDYKTQTERGWGREVINLSAYKDAEWIMINFEPEAKSLDMPFVIDNVYVIDYLKHNLQAKVSAPQNGAIGVETMVTVKVTNLGEETAKGYKVLLYQDGELLETVTDASDIPTYYDLARFFYVTPKLTDNETIAFTAVVDYKSDLDQTDNTSEPVTMEILQPAYPYVDDLVGEVDDKGCAVLRWTAPEVDALSTTTDSFELYNAWMTGGFGAWKTVDNDLAFTYGVDGIEFEHEGEPLSFMVFNPSAIGINTDSNTEFAPHAGQQYLICLSSVGSQTPEGHNDDWLISPLLSGNNQTISFYAKAMSANYAESFEIYYSNKYNNVEDFQLLKSVGNVPTSWTLYEQELPEGTRYFAVRCTSADAYALMIDDVTYTPAAMEVERYNIYRDKRLMGSVAASTTTYTDRSANGLHEYRVGVVYNVGDSRLSNTVTLLGATGIDEVGMTEADFSDADIYTLDGRFAAKGADRMQSLPQGTYILKTRNGNSRTIIKK